MCHAPHQEDKSILTSAWVSQHDYDENKSNSVCVSRQYTYNDLQ